MTCRRSTPTSTFPSGSWRPCCSGGSGPGKGAPGCRARADRALAQLAHQDTGEIADVADPANLAADLAQDELDLGQADDLRDELAAVERAEARLAAGTYGLSIESGKPIPDERLEAQPTAERTAEEDAR